MKEFDLNELSAAYADDELNESEEIALVAQKFELDEAFRTECHIQVFMKKLVCTKCSAPATPADVRARILSKTINRKPPAFPFITKLIAPPFSYALTFAVILIFSLITYISKLEQTSAAPINMFEQAGKNFKAILADKLHLEYRSSNPDELQRFFETKGVAYATHIPRLTNRELLGGVISVDNGEKCAHQLYAGKDGKTLVYVFQVHESLLKNNKTLTLPGEILARLSCGSCYEVHNGDVSTFFTKCGENVFGIITNEKSEEYADLVGQF